jgi:predicted GIY-YIG superfamily endonuclease
MSELDFLFRLFGIGEFNSAWSEPVYHEIHDELTNANTGKVYKQIGRILNFAEVPDEPGIYLIRDTYKTNIYVGQTHKPKQGLRTRLSRHLNGRGSKSLTEGIMYEIRWAETPGGEEMPKIAEALAVLHFKPDGNDHKDWLGNLDRAFAKNLSSQIIGEAKRLGFLRGSRKETEAYMNSLLKAVGRSRSK